MWYKSLNLKKKVLEQKSRDSSEIEIGFFFLWPTNSGLHDLIINLSYNLSNKISIIANKF